MNFKTTNYIYLLKQGIRIRLNENFQNNRKNQKSLNSIEEYYSNQGYSSFDFKGRILPENVLSLLSSAQAICFEITEKCNLKCKYCVFGELYSISSKRKNKSVNLDYCYKLIDFLNTHYSSNENIKNNKPISISFYGGEPLIEINKIKRIVNYLENKFLSIGKQLRFFLTTNAVLLKENIEYLVSKNFTLLISIDGNEYHNSYRVYKNGNSTFNDIFQNIQYVKIKYANYFSENVTFNAVLNNRSSESDVRKFFEQNFGIAEKLLVSEIADNGIDSKNIEKHKLVSNPAISSRIGNEELFSFFKKFKQGIKDDYSELFLNPEKCSIMPSAICMPFYTKIFLTVEGLILPCERIGRDFILGKVTKQKVDISFEKIAEMYNKVYNYIETQCLSCEKRFYCSSCFLKHYKHDKNSLCIDRKKAIFDDDRNEISYILQYLEANPERIKAFITND